MKYQAFYDNWKKYEIVRRSGVYNMITEATFAANAAGLTIEEYKDIINKYVPIAMEIEQEFGSVDSFLKN